MAESSASDISPLCVKIIVLGQANVGKTSIMKRFTEGTFDPRRQVTMGADYMARNIRIRDHDVLMQLWDTVGQEKFHHGNIGNSFYRNANGCLLVYDVTQENSLNDIRLWRDEIMSKVSNNETFPMVVVGNKVDKKDSPEPNAVQLAVMDWCAENGYGHIETSAKDDIGVEIAMQAITNLSLTYLLTGSGKQAQEDLDEVRKGSVMLDDMFKPKKSCPCSIV